MLLILGIMGVVFFDNHWSKVHDTFGQTLAGEIVALSNISDDALAAKMAKNMHLNMTRHEKLNRPARDDSRDPRVAILAHNLKKLTTLPTKIYIDNPKRLLFVDLSRPNGDVLSFATSLRRIYSSSVDVFVLYLFISLLAVSLAVAPFIIMHTRSIRRLARAANFFGRGMDLPNFHPSGSSEIRLAATSLISMKERLDRYNKTRSDMLNALAHDLKTPLARIRLGIETGSAKQDSLLGEIDNMSGMIGGYLAFARGELPEQEQEVSMASLLTRLTRAYEVPFAGEGVDAEGRRGSGKNFPTITLIVPDSPAMFYTRPEALARAIENLLINASRYAKSKIQITETDSLEFIEITIDDDGIGIPAERRDEAMQPFTRLDPARSGEGTGLGLSIAKQTIENHGGQMLLEDSPLGGLRVHIILSV
jgi:two-component system osmolarity sensor histidine kinase EnvZ